MCNICNKKDEKKKKFDYRFNNHVKNSFGKKWLNNGKRSQILSKIVARLINPPPISISGITNGGLRFA